MINVKPFQDGDRIEIRGVTDCDRCRKDLTGVGIIRRHHGRLAIIHPACDTSAGVKKKKKFRRRDVQA